MVLDGHESCHKFRKLMNNLIKKTKEQFGNSHSNNSRTTACPIKADGFSTEY